MYIMSEKSKNRTFLNILDFFLFRYNRITIRNGFSTKWKQWFYLKNGNIIMAIDNNNELEVFDKKIMLDMFDSCK